MTRKVEVWLLSLAGRFLLFVPVNRWRSLLYCNAALAVRGLLTSASDRAAITLTDSIGHFSASYWQDVPGSSASLSEWAPAPVCLPPIQLEMEFLWARGPGFARPL